MRQSWPPTHLSWVLCFRAMRSTQPIAFGWTCSGLKGLCLRDCRGCWKRRYSENNYHVLSDFWAPVLLFSHRPASLVSIITLQAQTRSHGKGWKI